MKVKIPDVKGDPMGYLEGELIAAAFRDAKRWRALAKARDMCRRQQSCILCPFQEAMECQMLGTGYIPENITTAKQADKLVKEFGL